MSSGSCITYRHYQTQNDCVADIITITTKHIIKNTGEQFLM